jgi:hypothetical protein
MRFSKLWLQQVSSDSVDRGGGAAARRDLLKRRPASAVGEGKGCARQES